MALLSCPVCLKPHFDGVDALRSSLISVATTHISCPVCFEAFLGLDKLTIHLFSHISQQNINSLELNIQKEVNEDIVMEEKRVDTCSMEPNNIKERVICDICNFHFSDDTILDLHQKLLHQTSPDKLGKSNYHCHLCSKQFKMRGSLMVHLRVAHFGFLQSNHKNAPRNVIRNGTAGEDSITSQAILFAPETQTSQTQRKLYQKSQDHKQYECEVCLKLFTTKYFLKKHKRLHTGEMPYYCGQCNKYFTFQQSYHKHMLYHSDDKPHICFECGRAFKELSTLHNHERIHSGERPFTCETCGKCFRQRVSYLVHRRIHTGVMPYKCTACNKSFRYKVSQRSHKCPANPPGSVIKAPALVEKLMRNQKTKDDCNQNALPMENKNSDLKFILNNNCLVSNRRNIVNEVNLSIVSSFDALEEGLVCGDVCLNEAYEQGNVKCSKTSRVMDINLNHSESHKDKMELQTRPEDGITEIEGGVENIDTSVGFVNSENDNNSDFFALILSPVLSDVESLRLSSYTNTEGESENVNKLQTINEESFKELLYGPSNS